MSDEDDHIYRDADDEDNPYRQAEPQASPATRSDAAGGQPNRFSLMCLWSFLCGIIGVMTCWCLPIACILAVIFGHIGLSQTNRDPQLDGRGFAVAGLILGYVCLGISAVLIILHIVFALTGQQLGPRSF